MAVKWDGTALYPRGPSPQQVQGPRVGGDVMGTGQAEVRAELAAAAISPIPTDAAARKKTPIWSGFIMYFPRAITKVSQVSHAGNAQHNGPDNKMKWDKTKNSNHYDTAMRHGIDHQFNPIDTDGQLHLAKAAWRIMAALETYLEEQNANNG